VSRPRAFTPRSAATIFARRLGTKDTPPSALKRFRYRLEAAGLRAVSAIIPMLPRSAAMGLARVLGSLAYYLLAEDRRVAYANLDIVFGDSKTLPEKRRIVRNTFQNLTANLVGLFWAPRITAADIDRYVEPDAASWEWLAGLKARGKGLICITPHYGDWELMSLASGYKGVTYTTVMEATKNPALQETISRLRSLSGHTTVHPRFAVVKLFKALSRGEAIGVLIDVNARRGRGGVWLDFFGLPVFNTAAVAELAMRTGAAIAFGAGHPLPGRRIKMIMGPEIVPDDTGDHAQDVLTTSQRCLDLCADLIRKNPEHWLWTYKRWKRRPSPEAGRYPFYSKYDANTLKE
jgi:Kdo2-lipid IVA lauroyltransferase/acyltransferase